MNSEMNDWEERMEQKRQEGRHLDDKLWEDEMEKLRDQKPTPGLVEAAKRVCSWAQNVAQSETKEMLELNRHQLMSAITQLVIALAEAATPPQPGLVEAASVGLSLLRRYRELCHNNNLTIEIFVRRAIDNLQSALAECGEWERCDSHTFLSDDDDPDIPCPICDALQIIEKKWPGAEVWRRKP